MYTREKKKLQLLENLVFLLGEKNYRNGFPYYNPNYQKRRKLFNPKFANTFIALMIFRDIISYSMTEDYYSLLIGDFVYKFDFKLQLNLIVSDMCLMLLLIELLNNLIIKKKRQIDLITESKFNSKESSAKKLIFYINAAEKVFTLSLFILCFSVSFVFLSIYCELISLLTIGIFWSIVFGLLGLIVGEMYVWNLIYFIFFCYYSKFMLKSENNRLKLKMRSDKVLNNFDIMITLRNFDLIYGKVMTFNEIWSPFLFINWIGWVFMMGLMSITVFFSGIDNIFIEIIFIIGLLIVIAFITPIVVFCSAVNLEANKSYKLSNQMSCYRNIKISFLTRYKVMEISI